MDKKKIIYIALFILATFIFGYAIYKVFFAPKTLPDDQISTPGGEGQFPDIGQGDEKIPTDISGPGVLPGVPDRPDESQTSQTPGSKIEKDLIEKKLVDTVISNPIARGNQINFYNQQDGKFYKVLSDGTIKSLDDKVFYNVQNISWSPTKDESIIEYPDGANIYYNFETKKQVTLPKHWQEFSFSPQGDQIAAKSIGISSADNWLIASDPDGKNIKLLEPMGNNSDKVVVDWSPNKQIVAMSATGDIVGFNQQEILMIGQNKENFKSIVVEGRGFKSKWSPEGSKLLHSVYNSRNEYKPELWIADASGNNIGNNKKLLNVNTWANKCTMADERYAYCGVPTTMEVGSGFAPELSQNTPDKLYKIDTNTGFKTEVPLDGFYVIEDIFVGNDGKQLYFTSKVDSGVYEINIK